MLKKTLGSLLAIVVSCSFLLWANPAQATIKINGELTAQEACAAVQSIRKGTNPGNITLTPSKTYSVIGKNREDATHYLLRIPDADPSVRWVELDCGEFTTLPSRPPRETVPSDTDDYLLALSWQPSFCETRPSKTECQTQTADRFDATHLVLHGLWPQPRNNIYCDVSDEIVKLDKNKRWLEMPSLELSTDTRNELQIKMPGYASGLHLHEWYKHGTCYSETPEEYYQESLMLLDQVNHSSVRQLIASNIGELIVGEEMRDEFDEAFGEGLGEKVRIRCSDDPDEESTMIGELWINLQGEIEADTSLTNLLENAPDAGSSCAIGEVDPAGFGPNEVIPGFDFDEQGKQIVLDAHVAEFFKDSEAVNSVLRGVIEMADMMTR